MNIANWLHTTARSMPAAPALYNGTELYADYATFAQRACALATGLQQQYGIRQGDRVALFMKNRVEYLEAFYAVWWLGAIAVPVNHKLHPSEVAWIVGNSEAALLISDDGTVLQSVADAPRCPELAADGAAFTALTHAEVPLTTPVTLHEDELAWLFYTSGTTGRPKGVMLSHGNLIAMSLAYTADVDEVLSTDAALYAAPISHGAGLYNMIHVRCGARHVVPPSRGFDSAEIFALAKFHGAISMFAAPTMIKRMVDEARRSGERGDGIKTIVYGGGPMYVADIQDALKVLGNRFVQIYGQGESPMTITALGRDHIADTTHPQWLERLASVGLPHSCADVRVVDDSLVELPPGVPGEIIVRGPAVMHGYWRNPTATRQSLSDGWLRTGDIGFFNADGFLTLTDRSKDVIISGGTNIYPREVEEVLMQHPAVKEVSVIGAPHPEWGEEVVAFVVLENGQPCSADDLEHWCKQHMASFKKPKRYNFQTELPKNSYGKILKTELRALDGAGGTQS
jgi:long-chain acyl-CoA synthetase